MQNQSTPEKYEFVEGDTKELSPGVIVKRIRALVAIPGSGMAPNVIPGELGGYIGDWRNLSTLVTDRAWVYNNALVCDNAVVYNNARVCDNAQVRDNALVCDNAIVRGNAKLAGNARVFSSDQVVWFVGVGSANGTLTMYAAKDNTIEVTRGCFTGSVDEFLAASARKHDARIQHEYKLLIEVGVSRITEARAKRRLEKTWLFTIEMMKRELARPDLQIYVSCRLALADLNSGQECAAFARLRVDADKLRSYDTPLNLLFESEESD